MKALERKLVSVVVPCMNEEGNIDRTLDGLLELAATHRHAFEVIVVNDGSTDGSWEVIRRYAREHEMISGIDLMTNFGQSAAYQAGFDAAQGEYVLLVSADLEIPLHNLLRVIDHLDEGYDFVNTHRVGRWSDERDKAVKSGLANRLIKRISGVEVKDRGSGMKGLRRVLVDNLRLYGEMHRFIPDYVSQHGARMIEFDVEFRDRDYGQSYYAGHRRTMKVVLDLFTLAFLLYFARRPFSFMPGRLFGFTGVVLGGLGFIGASYLTVLKLMGHAIGHRPLLLASVLLIIVGVQFVMMGMLGELMLRVYFESSSRKTYAVRRTAGARHVSSQSEAAPEPERKAKP